VTSSDEYLFIKKLESAQNWQDIEVISIEKFNTLGLSRFIYIYIPPESYFDRQAFIIHHKGYKEDQIMSTNYRPFRVLLYRYSGQDHVKVSLGLL